MKPKPKRKPIPAETPSFVAVGGSQLRHDTTTRLQALSRILASKGAVGTQIVVTAQLPYAAVRDHQADLNIVLARQNRRLLFSPGDTLNLTYTLDLDDPAHPVTLSVKP